jgi:hypothetical protein
MGMFVRRNAFGDIVAVSRSALDAGWDEIPDHAPALREFLAESGWQRDNPFAQSDAEPLHRPAARGSGQARQPSGAARSNQPSEPAR